MVGGLSGALGHHASVSLQRNNIGVDHAQILRHLENLEETVQALVMSRGSVARCRAVQMESESAYAFVGLYVYIFGQLDTLISLHNNSVGSYLGIIL